MRMYLKMVSVKTTFGPNERHRPKNSVNSTGLCNTI